MILAARTPRAADSAGGFCGSSSFHRRHGTVRIDDAVQRRPAAPRHSQRLGVLHFISQPGTPRSAINRGGGLSPSQHASARRASVSREWVQGRRVPVRIRSWVAVPAAQHPTNYGFYDASYHRRRRAHLGRVTLA